MKPAEKTENWQVIGTINDFSATDRFVKKIGERQIAVFKTKTGIFAINNRCPHEGFPLLEGTLQDKCVIACNWHGWTFDLSTGKALQGRDAVKTYPVKQQGKEILVDLTPISPLKRQKDAAVEFDESSTEHDYERMARALCRYEVAGGTYESLAIQTLMKSRNQLERGFGHGHAGLADWIKLAGTDNELRLVAFLEALGHFAWDGLFEQDAPISESAVHWDKNAFAQAIEAMNQGLAISLCNGGFEAGLGFKDLKPIFLDIVFSHYAGFGHPAIYIQKAEELINLLGREIEHLLCLQLTRYLCYAAREDLIPEFRGFTDLLAEQQKESSFSLPDSSSLSGMGLRQLLPLVDGASFSAQEKWEALLAATAWDMLKFDHTRQNIIEQPIAQNVGWLDFTHAITFAEALYSHAVNEPKYWRSGHLQQACFIGRNARFLGEERFEQYKVLDPQTFISTQKAALFDMDVGEYIYSVHRLKLVIATEKLIGLVSKNTCDLLLAALNRFLSSPLRQKHPARTAFQARATVMRE